MSCYDLGMFVHRPAGPVRCCVDGGVAKDAVRSTVCGHIYGMQCILDSLMKLGEFCPSCHAPMDCTQLAPADDVRQMVLQLQVRCPEGRERCDWTGPMADVAAHVGGAGCGVRRVTCPFCSNRYEEGVEFQRHKEVCPECIVLCPKCFEDMTRRELEEAHEAVCTAAPIEPIKQSLKLKEEMISKQKQQQEEGERGKHLREEEELPPSFFSPDGHAALKETKLEFSPAPQQPSTGKTDRDVNSGKKRGESSSITLSPPIAPTFTTTQLSPETLKAAAAKVFADPTSPSSIINRSSHQPTLQSEEEKEEEPPRSYSMCPFASVGCVGGHATTTLEMGKPAVLQKHLCAVVDELLVQKSANAALKVNLVSCEERIRHLETLLGAFLEAQMDERRQQCCEQQDINADKPPQPTAAFATPCRGAQKKEDTEKKKEANDNVQHSTTQMEASTTKATTCSSARKTTKLATTANTSTNHASGSNSTLKFVPKQPQRRTAVGAGRGHALRGLADPVAACMSALKEKENVGSAKKLAHLYQGKRERGAFLDVSSSSMKH